MQDINNVTLIGRLTKDAELKYLPNGTALAKLSIAVNRSVKRNDVWEDEASFFDATLFGKMAESLSKYMLKGKRIAITGELRQERWEKDGQKQSKVVVVVQTVQLLEKIENKGTVEPFTSTVSNHDEYTDDIPF